MVRALTRDMGDVVEWVARKSGREPDAVVRKIYQLTSAAATHLGFAMAEAAIKTGKLSKAEKEDAALVEHNEYIRKQFEPFSNAEGIAAPSGDEYQRGLDVALRGRPSVQRSITSIPRLEAYTRLSERGTSHRKHGK